VHGGNPIKMYESTVINALRRRYLAVCFSPFSEAVVFLLTQIPAAKCPFLYSFCLRTELWNTNRVSLISWVLPREQGLPREVAQRLTSLLYLESKAGTSVRCPGEQRPCPIHLLDHVFLHSSAGELGTI